MADIDAILGKGIGGDILAGSTARYHQAEANKVSSEAANALAVAPDVPAALKGDADAFGRVAAKSPKTADVLGQALQRMNASQAAHTLAVANYASNTSAGILAAPPEARGSLYDQAKVEAAKAGMDTASWPAQYNEGWIRFQQAKGAGAKAAFEAQEKMRLHTTPGARAAGGGGGEEVIPDGTAVPGRQSAIPGPAAPAMAQAAPPDAPDSPPAPAGPVVAQAPVAAPTGPAAAPQMAQAGPPPGFQAMGHRDPQGNLVPALINGQAVHRNPQTGEMVLVPVSAPPQAAPVVAQAAPPINPRAMGSEAALSSGAPGDQPPGSALPEGIQVAQNTPKPGAIIYDDPAQMGGKMLGVKQPNGTYKPVEGPGGTVKYRLPDGTTVYYGPHLKDPTATERPQPPPGFRWTEGGPSGKRGMEFIPGGPQDPAVAKRLNVPPGYQPGEDGGLVPIPGGPADPAVMERSANAKRAANEKAIPQTVTKGMQENVNALKQIDRVDSLLEKNGDSIGGAGSVAASILPGAGWLQNRMDPEGVNIRALVADIGSMKIHDRSGAAVTASEFPRLRPFIPTIADDAATVRKKLANFRAEYTAMLSDTANYYGADNGFKPYTPATDYLAGNNKGEPGEASKSATNDSGPRKLGANGEGYDQVPAGDQYIAPDGSTRTKGGKK